MNSAGGIFTGNGGNASNPIVANVSDTNTGFFYPAADNIAVTTGGSERLRITSGGQVCIGTDTAVRALTIKQPGQIHLESTDTGNWLGVSLKGSSGTNNYNAYFGLLDSNGDFFIDNGSNGNDFVITQSGQVNIGTSGTLKAEINNAVSGHQFISQCDDNNNGFEVYQKHGASTTRNTFAVYANTGSSGAKQGQFLVRGDGVVSVGGDFGFDKFTPDGTITTTISSNSSSGNYTTIIPLNTSGISHLHVYLVSIHWSFNSNGSAPYYCSGAVLWQTPHTNQSNGVGYPYEMLSSCHIGGNYYLKIRNITGSSSYPGLQAANIGWTAIAGSHYIVKYKRIY